MPPVVPHISLSADEFAELRGQRYAVPVDDAVFRFEGTGTIDCLQGLLTNDVAKPARGSAVWGAFLTAKGMIITDAWVLRETEAAWVVVPASMRTAVSELFRRTIPPRLAKVTDHSDTHSVRWLCGGTPSGLQEGKPFVPHGMSPFTEIMITDDGAALDARLLHHGWQPVKPVIATLSKLLMGWPTLGREIDERTLPQEARFDELGGVKYDKGCYTGQETVARVHFRGHTNRVLRGVCWAPGDRPTDAIVTDGDKVVGTIRTMAQLGDRCVALATRRSEAALCEMARTGP